MERFCDRLRASNTYGEPIVRFNEDSATISQMREFVAEEMVPIHKKLKGVLKVCKENEPVIDDVKQDVDLIKSMFKKH